MNQRPLKIALLAEADHVNCQRWCEGLRMAGADVHVISFHTRASTETQTYRLYIRPLPYKLHYVAAVPYVRRLLKTIKPDVVLAYYVTGYGTLAALTGFRPLVQVTSGSDVLVAPRNPIMKLLLRFNLKRADLVTAWAPHMAEAARKLGAEQGRIVILPRGIPYEHFASKRALPPNKNETARIISTRSLLRHYNIDRLVEAVHLLHLDGFKCSLTIVGDGPYRSQIAAYAKQLGILGQIRFVGFVSNDQVAALLAQHHIYVSLIDSDGISASLLEAMTAGLLPIVPDHPANRSWIQSGENGLLLEDLEPSAIANKIRRAVSDLPLRYRAWRHNEKLVRESADLYRNSQIFLQRFRKLARYYHNREIDGSSHFHRRRIHAPSRDADD